jgi:hypothetical protein
MSATVNVEDKRVKAMSRVTIMRGKRRCYQPFNSLSRLSETDTIHQIPITIKQLKTWSDRHVLFALYSFYSVCLCYTPLNAGKRRCKGKCCSKPSVFTDTLAEKRPATWRDLRAMSVGWVNSSLSNDHYKPDANAESQVKPINPSTKIPELLRGVRQSDIRAGDERILDGSLVMSLRRL